MVAPGRGAAALRSGKACAMAAPGDDDTEWVLPSVAAERLGVVRSTVVTRIRRGDLEGRKNERGHWVVRLPVLSASAAPAPRRATLSAEEAVAMTGVRPREFWMAVYQRRLPVLRHGRELRFSRGDLEAWIETQRLPTGRKGGRSRPVAAEAGEELLTFEAAAARLGVAPTTLWRWLNAARLPFVLAPGVRQRSVRCVRPADLKRLADQRRIDLRRPR